MTQYGWTNEDGEPIMSGEAWRFEQQLNLDSQADYYEDHFYDDRDDPDYEECPDCEGDMDPTTGCCFDCGYGGLDEPDEPEDAFLDSYMEDRITDMYQ